MATCRFAIAFLAVASAQYGGQQMRHGAAGGNDVDLAMAGWDQLSKSPEKMQELFASFKDPEVMAKAQEMLKDPAYMAAAKRKVADLQAKAHAQGLVDAEGKPRPGAAAAIASQGGVPGEIASSIMNNGNRARGEAGDDAAAAREWELSNLERHRSGEMNDAELGMANLRQAMGDPSVMGEVNKMLQNPENMAQLKRLMADPTFQEQAKRVAGQMKASGGMPDFSQMAQALGGAGGGAAAGGAEAEIARLRRENAALKQRAGLR